MRFTVLLALLVTALIHPRYAPHTALAAPRTSANIAYVTYDDSGFTGSFDHNNGTGNIFSNAIPDGPPATSNPSAAVTYNTMTFSPLALADVSTSSLQRYDTLILFEICNIDTLFSTEQHSAINSFVESGGKLLIFDSDRCSDEPGGAGSANYSWFMFPFSTSAPGPRGATSKLTVLEDSPLTVGLTGDSFGQDELGDANTAVTSAPGWFAAAKTTNHLGHSGYFLAYASRGGLALYNGADYWFTDGPTQSLEHLFVNELNLRWNPDELPRHHPILPPIPGPPTAVSARTSGPGMISVTWTPPPGAVSSFGVALYKEHVDSKGDSARHMELEKTTTVPLSTTSVTFRGLVDGVAYAAQVWARNGAGKGPVVTASPDHVCPGTPPTTPPRRVVVLVMGLNSSLPSSAYNPIRAMCDLHTARNGVLRKMGEYWDSVGRGTSSDFPTMANALESTGAVLLPFSYNEAYFLPNGPSPRFQVNAYSRQVANDADPAAAALVLDYEIEAIRENWRKAQITVIGHSLGGVVAETWWDTFPNHARRSNHIVGVYSLDSPINGFDMAGALSVLNVHCDAFLPCTDFARFEVRRWLARQSYDSHALSEDAKKDRSIYTSLATWHDFVMFLASWPDDGMCTQALGTFHSFLGGLFDDIWGTSGPNDLDCGLRMTMSSAPDVRITGQDGGGNASELLGLQFPSHNVVLLDANNIRLLRDAVMSMGK